MGLQKIKRIILRGHLLQPAQFKFRGPINSADESSTDRPPCDIWWVPARCSLPSNDKQFAVCRLQWVKLSVLYLGTRRYTSMKGSFHSIHRYACERIAVTYNSFISSFGVLNKCFQPPTTERDFGLPRAAEVITLQFLFYIPIKNRRIRSGLALIYSSPLGIEGANAFKDWRTETYKSFSLA